MELDLKLTTALLGSVVDIDTLDGKIELKIPAGTTHNEILRIKEKEYQMAEEEEEIF